MGFHFAEDTEAREDALRDEIERLKEKLELSRRGARNLAALASIRLHEVWPDLTDEAKKKWLEELAAALDKHERSAP